MSQRFKPLLFATSLIFTVLLISTYALPSARAADIVISDEASCEAAGGYWDANTCELRLYTVAAGDTLTALVDIDFSNLVNNGSINARSIYTSSFVNNSGAVITTNRRFRLSSGSGTNYGTINGNIENFGTITNNCPGVINGSVIGGTYINNCATATPTPTKTFTPTATFTASNTATFTPSNTAVPPSLTPSNTPSNTPVPPTSTYTNTPSNTPVPPTATYTTTSTNTSVPPTATYTNTSTNTAVPPTATFTPSNTPTNTATPTPSGFAKAQFNHGNEISVTKSEKPNIIFQYGATTGLPLSNPRLECSITGQATFVLPVSSNGFTTVNATATAFTLSGRAAIRNGQNYSATFKVNPGPTLGQISTLTCTLVGDNFAAVSDTLNIRVR